MSVDLDFWKYKPGVDHDDQRVYEALSDGETLADVQELPIEEIRARVREVFSGWKWPDKDNCENPAGKGGFTLYTTSQLVRFDCYWMSEEQMNRLMDILIEGFGCPLYDPQVSTRFDGWTEV